MGINAEGHEAIMRDDRSDSALIEVDAIKIWQTCEEDMPLLKEAILKIKKSL